MSNVASIQKITNLRPHPNADALELVDILGWQVVVKKGEFKEGDLCVYIATDSIVEERPEYEFLRKNHFRIRPVKLRQQPSNGIVFPLDILGEFDVDVDCMGSNTFTKNGKSLYLQDLTPGYDVSEWVGAKHYEKPIPAQLAGKVIGYLPAFIRKTDEQNIRSCPEILTELNGLPYYISRKDDGSSGTFFAHSDENGVCSRNLQLAEDDVNGFWRMAKKYDIFTKIRDTFGTDYAVQGEVVGPGVNGNNLGLTELDLHIFNVIALRTGEYLPLDTLKGCTASWSIPMVTIIEEGDSFGYELHELISLANAQTYPNDKPAEGIVIRPKKYTRTSIDKMAWNALSGKIINENYKEKE